MDKKKQNKIILFDLGDTIFYREKPIIEFDIDLINEFLKIKSSVIEDAILKIERQYQGIYKPWLNNKECNSLEKEYRYVYNFFNDLFKEIHATKWLNEFLFARKREIRYKLFRQAKQYLQLFSTKYDLGIVTNGRPSRRDIVKQLKIDKYFKNDLIFVSDEIGFSKPDKPFFDYVLKRVDKYQQCIMCDDEDRNIEYAKKIGWSCYKIDHKKLGFKVLDVLK